MRLRAILQPYVSVLHELAVRSGRKNGVLLVPPLIPRQLASAPAVTGSQYLAVATAENHLARHILQVAPAADAAAVDPRIAAALPLDPLDLLEHPHVAAVIQLRWAHPGLEVLVMHEPQRERQRQRNVLLLSPPNVLFGGGGGGRRARLGRFLGIVAA